MSDFPINYKKLIEQETKDFVLFYQWIQEHIPPSFLQAISQEHCILLTHALLGFVAQNHLVFINTAYVSFVLYLENKQTEAVILEPYLQKNLKSYHSFIANASPPFPGMTGSLKIAKLTFHPPSSALEEPCLLQNFPQDHKGTLLQLLTHAEESYQSHIEVKSKNLFSVLFAWKGVKTTLFLFEIAKMVQRYGYSFEELHALDVNGDALVVSMTLKNRTQDFLEDFLQELSTQNYFQPFALLEKTFIDTGLLSGYTGNLLKSLILFLQELLVCCDKDLYSLSYIENILCCYPEFISALLEAFCYKFHKKKLSLSLFKEKMILCHTILASLSDPSHQKLLRQALYFVDHCLKTNFYIKIKGAFSFRFDSNLLQNIFPDEKEKFPEPPYAIFFLKGEEFFGFHIRFRDLARGGLRTVLQKNTKASLREQSQIFFECYHLAYTQQKKNKDIPEGGAKGVIFLETQKDILYRAQKSYIKGLLQLINCHADGTLKEEGIVDYVKKPEYLYLGPDENMHNAMIEWIATYSQEQGYKPGSAFISSKPDIGINHKEFGVTSFGVNVYLEEVLKHIGIDPTKDIFTLKMTGGPDGDVAGNQMLNLYKYYPLTAKLRTTLDISGVIFDPQGLDLSQIQILFYKEKPICDYPKHKLSPHGFMLDRRTKKEQGPHAGQTLCVKNIEGTFVETWLSDLEVQHFLRYTIHKTSADVFIPAGGRPGTLQEANIQDFLDESGNPTAKVIIEGANLYLTPKARNMLETLGVLIIKDSSANKGGVICSSFEVLANLCLSPEEFLQEKVSLAEEILTAIACKAQEEALLLLSTRETTKAFLTAISDELSDKINSYTDQIFSCLEPLFLQTDAQNPFNQVLLHYCLPTLRKKYKKNVLSRVPDIHKKAIIARHLASTLIYSKGLSSPTSPQTELDLLSLIAENAKLFFLI